MPLAHPFETTLVPGADDTLLAAHTTAGSSSLPWVLLLGSPSVALPFWRSQVEYLASRFRFVTWDYRGLYGSKPSTDPAAHRFTDHRGDLLAVLDALKIDRCSVVSWSIGAELALDFAADHLGKVESLALLNPVFPARLTHVLQLPSQKSPAAKLLGLGRSVYPLLAPLQQRVGAWPESAAWMKRMGLAAATIDDEVYAEITAAFRTLDMRAYRACVAAFEGYDRRLPVESLKVPSLVVAGEADRIGSLAAAKRIARSLPYGELFSVKSGTHYTPIEYPELVNLRIEKFFDALPRR